MKHFKHMQATSADQAAKEAASGKAWVMAGGTDLLGTLKDEIFPEYPETVIDLKTIEGMDAIEEDGDALRIGALAKLSDVAENELVKTYAAALAQAAGRVASPTIRHMGTIGGHVCQMHRCWYFRVPDDRFHCRRKGGATCPARIGDNRYHSIFGGMKAGITPCSAECPANTDIPAYMARYRAGDMEGAARILMQANPLPMMTSRVCAHT